MLYLFGYPIVSVVSFLLPLNNCFFRDQPELIPVRYPVSAQLSRAVESRVGNRPQLSDLRDSGSLEQDADIVLMLYREDMYNEDCEQPGVTDLYIRKNRSGPTGSVSLFFDAKRMTFRSLDRTAKLQPVATLD